MKLVRLAVLGFVALAYYCAPAADAQQNQGQGFTVDTRKLQKPATSFYPGEIQIINSGPVVKDLRTGPEGPNNVVLNLGAPPSSPGSTTVVNLGGPAGAAPQGVVAGPGQVVLNMNRPPSGFQSNMNSLKSPTGLPTGNTTNRLANTAIGTVNGQLKTPVKRTLTTKPATAQPLTLASYPNQYKTRDGFSTGNQIQSTTGLSGRILGRQATGKQ